ncbi:hypothetical protein [Mesorhizobium sp.]|uniref:hypothetical protein n=1 Tax=Mesorhizobium sp. TaxID=1871066 RepID=UPI000FD3865C|nr:hypothetical protein [Mesorhizobium sp.]RVC57683.1 hypothetical protein EN779_21100 [Mesorhizobium sp. M4B.F.Ca.ET.088.02.2.1]RWF32427.1 MAG: hypothetical protein EOS45_06830 [Mesorhizobium sp.]
MTTGPEMKEPGGGAPGSLQQHFKRQGRTFDREEINRNLANFQAASVVSSVRSARTHLLAAQLGLDDAGFYCSRLDDLQDGAAMLLADWAGRRRPGFGEPVPAYVTEAAIAWRYAARRSY